MLEKCIELVKAWKELATAHLETLRDNPDHRVLLSDQMHHICDKYSQFVGAQLPFKLDAAVFDCLDQCVFSLLVAQPPHFYTKWFLRIASCYGQMSAYFKRVRCKYAEIYSRDAHNVYKMGAQSAEDLVPADPARCLQTSINLAEFTRYGLREKANPSKILASAIRRADGVATEDGGLSKAISEAKAKLEEWKE